MRHFHNRSASVRSKNPLSWVEGPLRDRPIRHHPLPLPTPYRSRPTPTLAAVLFCVCPLPRSPPPSPCPLSPRASFTPSPARQWMNEWAALVRAGIVGWRAALKLSACSRSSLRTPPSPRLAPPRGRINSRRNGPPRKGRRTAKVRAAAPVVTEPRIAGRWGVGTVHAAERAEERSEELGEQRRGLRSGRAGRRRENWEGTEREKGSQGERTRECEKG